MATPYVVSKLPLSKSKKCDGCAPSPPEKLAYGKPLKNSVGACGFSCNTWCPACVNHDFRDNSDFVRMQLDSVPVKSALISPTKDRKNLPSTAKSLTHFTIDAADGEDSRIPHLGLKSEPWITVSNSVQEKYLREVEALRGKLRELRGATPRKLPTPPTQSKQRSTHTISKGPVTPSPGSYFNVDTSHSVVATVSSEEEEKRREERNSDTNRARPPNEVQCPTVPTLSAIIKRHRDKSPPRFQDDIEKPAVVGRSSPASFPAIRSCGNKMATTCVERDIGEHISIRIDRNNEVSCSISQVQPDVRISSSTCLPISANGHSQKELSLNHVFTEGKKNRSSSFSGSSTLTDSILPSPLKEREEPISLQGYDLSGCSEKKELSTTEPSTSSVSLDSETHSSSASSQPEKGEKDLFYRKSLFSNVPPYVRFIAHDEKANYEVPKAIQKALKWKLSTITPLVVKHTVVNSGFRLVKRTGEWGGVWGRHMKSVCFKTLYDYQKINHLPGTFQIGRKDRLWKNVYRFMMKFGKKEFGFLPRTFVLPQDGKALRQAWDKSSKSKWIIKPPAAARGTGIKVINKWAQVPKKAPVIVQKYISNPFLINGNKFDLRLYVLVTSFHPMKLYLYTNGLVRFASVKYSDDNASLSNRYMHLTNYSINKLSNNYAVNDDANACLGHKWALKSLWNYLEGTVNVDNLWNKMVDLVVKTMISGEAPIVNLSSANLNSRYSAYELFGVDVLLDENLKPWLLEVNISPSLHSTSPLDIAVKGPMVRDILNIAGFHIPDRFNDISKEELSRKLDINGPLCYDSRMYVPELSPSERAKQSFYADIAEREAYLDNILEELTPDDVRHLITYEDEKTQLGDFQKIFPTPESYEYFPFFETNRYYNMLFDAWETKFQNNRLEGIELLESKCLASVHLDVSDVEPRIFTYCVSETSSLKDEDVADGDADSSSADSVSNRINSNNTKAEIGL